VCIRDEADALGDRIAVLSKGRLTVFGSPMYLKSVYGLGYRLRVAADKRPGTSRTQGVVMLHLCVCVCLPEVMVLHTHTLSLSR
jgi:ABC-type multidrug transport system ATPase subunit